MRLRTLPILIAAAVALASCASAFTTAAAVVNGERLSVEEVELQVDAQLGTTGGPQSPEQRLTVARRVIMGFIQQRILRDEARRRGFEVSEAQIEQELDGLRQEFGGEQAFQERVNEAGLTMSQVRERIEDQLLLERLRTDLVGEITEAQVRERYREQRDRYRQVRVRHMLFFCCQPQGEPEQQRAEADARRLAQNAKQLIEDGRSFASIARQRSEDTGSARAGGLLNEGGWVELQRLDRGFAQAAWDARIGQVTDPVRSQFGFHLIMTLGKRTQPFEQVAAAIRGELEQEMADEALSTFVEDQLSRIDVTVNPRYGEWDPQNEQIVDRDFYLPPAIDPGAPPGR